MIQTPYFFIFFGFAAVGLITVGALLRAIQAIPVDNKKAQTIADAIRSGAMAFLKEEYKIIAVAIICISVLLSY